MAAVTFSEITKMQKREKASEEMVLTTLEPVLKREMRHYQADQSRFLRSVAAMCTEAA